MIKQHNITGLRYLCITVREKWRQYTGSGTRWKAHLNKHGIDFNTELLYETHDYDDFVKVCVFYSNFYNVVENDEFANVIHEIGYDNGVNICNFVIFWDIIDEQTKQDIYNRRRNSLVNNGNHWAHSEESKEIVSSHISFALKSRWGSLTESEKKSISEQHYQYYEPLSDNQKEVILTNLIKAREKAVLFYEDKECERYKEYVKSQSQIVTEWHANMTENEKIEFGQKISEGRLAMSEEAKKLRGERVSESFKTSEKRQQFNEDMKVERLGINNPNAKIVVWMGVEMTKSDFLALNIDETFAEEMFKTRDDCVPAEPPRQDYDPIYCPHCAKSSGNSKPSAFKRWHFDNCKERQ
jgi:hypothetical protein